jgi:hypothetical protein
LTEFIVPSVLIYGRSYISFFEVKFDVFDCVDELLNMLDDLIVKAILRIIV